MSSEYLWSCWSRNLPKITYFKFLELYVTYQMLDVALILLLPLWFEYFGCWLARTRFSGWPSSSRWNVSNCYRQIDTFTYLFFVLDIASGGTCGRCSTVRICIVCVWLIRWFVLSSSSINERHIHHPAHFHLITSIEPSCGHCGAESHQPHAQQIVTC